MRGPLLMLAALLGVTAVAALAALAPGAAHAQAAVLQPSAEQQCLRHVDGATQLPEYPIEAYNAAQAGRLQVLLVFAQPDRPPETTVLLQEGGVRFQESVLRHVRGLRVPCMDAAKGPVRLRKDFVFDPGTRQVAASEAQDPDEARRAALLGCMVHASGWKVPTYPETARRMSLQGRVVVRARYANATEAPQVQVFARPYAKRLADEMADWMQNTRLPCHTGEPITADWTYIFVLEDDRYGFKGLSFMQFLARTKGVRDQTLLFDTDAMDCPFDVLLGYRQPELPNNVEEVGTRHPARRALLNWMATSELDVPRLTANAIWGDTARITIPCLKIDLKPKEKS